MDRREALVEPYIRRLLLQCDADPARISAPQRLPDTFGHGTDLHAVTTAHRLPHPLHLSRA